MSYERGQKKTELEMLYDVIYGRQNPKDNPIYPLIVKKRDAIREYMFNDLMKDNENYTENDYEHLFNLIVQLINVETYDAFAKGFATHEALCCEARSFRNELLDY